MLKKEKIRLMTKLARYESGEGKEELRIARYYRSDYIGLALFRNFFLASIGYLVILLLVGAYFAEFLADQLHTLNVTWIGMMIVGGYLVTIGVYSVVTYTLHTIRYGRAQKGAAAYERRLRELEALYEEELKGKLKMLYASYGSYLLVLFKFLLAFLVFEEINRLLPYVEGLDQIFVVLLASLICSIMPWNLMVFLGMGLIVGQCYGIGIEIAGFALALIVIMVILYLRFTPQDALVLLLTPVAFSFGVPCLIPIGYGLTRTPSSAISAGFGVILYYFMELVSDNASVLTGADKEEKIQNLQFLSDGLMKNQEMMVTIIAFVTVLVIVYVVRRLEVEYAWHIAVFGGGIAYMIIMAAGGIFLEATIPVVPLVAGTMVSVFVGEILEFFFFHVDYKRTERLQFEDDEYYYYVKAVPKIKDMKKSSGRKPEEVPVDSAVIRNRERE